jgi:hypothetical protein
VLNIELLPTTPQALLVPPAPPAPIDIGKVATEAVKAEHGVAAKGDAV